MKLNDLWLDIKQVKEQHLLIKLDWMLTWRTKGINIDLDRVDYEIEFSSGNMRWVDNLSDYSILKVYNAATYINTVSNSFLIHRSDNIIIAGVCDEQFESKYTVETEFDDKIRKLNNRTKLLGLSEKYITNGVGIVKCLYDDSRSRKIEKDVMYADTDMRVHVSSDTLDVTEFNSICLLNYDLADLEISSSKKNHLRYLTGNTDFPDILIHGDNLTIEEISLVTLLPGMETKVKRITACRVLHQCYDLSGVEYIAGLYGPQTEGDVVLDFKDKFVMLGDNALQFRSKPTVKCSNEEMRKQLVDMNNTIVCVDGGAGLNIIFEG